MPSIGGLDGLVRGSERKSNLLLQLLLTLVKLLFFQGLGIPAWKSGKTSWYVILISSLSFCVDEARVPWVFTLGRSREISNKRSSFFPSKRKIWEKLLASFERHFYLGFSLISCDLVPSRVVLIYLVPCVLLSSLTSDRIPLSLCYSSLGPSRTLSSLPQLFPIICQ